MRAVCFTLNLLVLMAFPFGSVIGQGCPSDKIVVFADKRKACLNDYPAFRDLPVEARGKVITFNKAFEDFGGLLAVAASECGGIGTSFMTRPLPQFLQAGFDTTNTQAIKACSANQQKTHSIDEKRSECACTIALNSRSLSREIVLDLAKSEFEAILNIKPALASMKDNAVPGGVVESVEAKKLASERARLEADRQAFEKARQAKIKEDEDRQKERARLEADRQALEKARQAKIKEDEDRQKERARLEADRQALEKTRLAQLKETEIRAKEIARVEAEAKARDQKTRTELQSRTTSVNERFQPGKATGSADSWAIYKSGVPFQQQQFCRITENFRQEIEDARIQKNQIKENVAFRTREQRLTALLPEGNFSNWIVRAVSVKQASDGSAAVLFELPCDVIIGSNACSQNAKSFLGTIPENSRLYVELATISVGDFLGVSGSFNFVDEKAAFQKGRSVASFRAMAADSHCEAKDVAKPGVDFFASSVQNLTNLK